MFSYIARAYDHMMELCGVYEQIRSPISSELVI